MPSNFGPCAGESTSVEMSAGQNHRVTVISVSYNSMTVLPSMLASLPECTPAVVVDNASDDADELQMLCDRLGKRLIRNEINVGFGVACNQGAAAAETEFLGCVRKPIF